MSAEIEGRRSHQRPPGASDEAVRMLTDILKQVGAGLQPRPLGETAEEAIKRYIQNRQTLDNDPRTPAPIT
jgi:hypothetical protein